MPRKAPKKIRSKFINERVKTQLRSSYTDFNTASVDEILNAADPMRTHEARELISKIENGEIRHLSATQAALLVPHEPANIRAIIKAQKEGKKTKKKILSKMPISVEEGLGSNQPNIHAQHFLENVAKPYQGKIDATTAIQLLQHIHGLSKPQAKRQFADQTRRIPSLAREGAISHADFREVLHHYDKKYGRGIRSHDNLFKALGKKGPPADLPEMEYGALLDRTLTAFRHGRFSIPPSLWYKKVPSVIEKKLKEQKKYYRLKKTNYKGALMPKVERSKMWKNNNKALLTFLGIPPGSRYYDNLDKNINFKVAESIGNAVADLVDKNRLLLEFKQKTPEMHARGLYSIAKELSKDSRQEQVAKEIRKSARYIQDANISFEHTNNLEWRRDKVLFLKKLGIRPRSKEYPELLRHLTPENMQYISHILAPIAKSGVIGSDFAKKPVVQSRNIRLIAKELEGSGMFGVNQVSNQLALYAKRRRRNHYLSRHIDAKRRGRKPKETPIKTKKTTTQKTTFEEDLEKYHKRKIDFFARFGITSKSHEGYEPLSRTLNKEALDVAEKAYAKVNKKSIRDLKSDNPETRANAIDIIASSIEDHAFDIEEKKPEIASKLLALSSALLDYSITIDR